MANLEGVTGRKIVEFSTKGAVKVSLSGFNGLTVGCSVQDLNFKHPSIVGEITFTNYYTANISVLVRKAGDVDKKTGKHKPRHWETAVVCRELMPSPHLENGSQDPVSVTSVESSCDWSNLLSVRLILRQPSHIWKSYHLDDITVYADLPRLKNVNYVQSESDKLLSVLKRQTIEALNWSPAVEAKQAGTSPRPYGREQYKAPACYEITKLPVS